MSDVIEVKPTSYYRCSAALLTMWVDGVITKDEYYTIMSKLDEKHIKKKTIRRYNA